MLLFRLFWRHCNLGSYADRHTQENHTDSVVGWSLASSQEKRWDVGKQPLLISHSYRKDVMWLYEFLQVQHLTWQFNTWFLYYWSLYSPQFLSQVQTLTQIWPHDSRKLQTWDKAKEECPSGQSKARGQGSKKRRTQTRRSKMVCLSSACGVLSSS